MASRHNVCRATDQNLQYWSYWSCGWWPVLIAGNLEENLISGAWSDFLKFMLIVLIFGGLTPICRFWRLREIQAWRKTWADTLDFILVEPQSHYTQGCGASRSLAGRHNLFKRTYTLWLWMCPDAVSIIIARRWNVESESWTSELPDKWTGSTAGALGCLEVPMRSAAQCYVLRWHRFPVFKKMGD